jgi:hypothetical protein
VIQRLTPISWPIRPGRSARGWGHPAFGAAMGGRPGVQELGVNRSR